MKHRSTISTLVMIVALVAALGGRLGAQQFDIRVVHMVAGTPNVDVYFNDITTAIVTDLPYENTTALATRIPVGTGTLNLKVAPAGMGIGAATINQDVTVKSAYEYSAVIYPTHALPKVFMLDRVKTRVPAASKSLLRILNITMFSAPAAFDVYLDSTGGTPLFAGVAAETASNTLDVQGVSQTVLITPAGSKTVVGRLIAPLISSGQMTLIISGTSQAGMKVHALSGENHEGYILPTLQGISGGMLPSVRVVHAWWQPKPVGTGIQALDIYLNSGTTPRTTGLHYRNASEKFGPFTDDTATVKFAPFNEDVILTEQIKLNRDTDYVAILTKSKEGAAAALTLGAPNAVPGNPDSLVIRAAYVTDFHSNVHIRITHAGGVIELPSIAFLTSTGWFTIPRGKITVEAFRGADTNSFYKKEDPGSFATTYLTVIVLGSEQTFDIDILNELLPVRQEFDPSSGVDASPVAGLATLDLRAVPNPTSGPATIFFSSPSAGHAMLTVVDQLGRTVATPLDGMVEAGAGHVDVNTAGLAPGAYFYRLQAPGGAIGVGRMMVVR